MAAPFGFSFGDFIAGICLLKDAVGAFSDTKGARASYQALSLELDSLQSALEGIGDQAYDMAHPRQRLAIDEALERCQRCTNEFVKRISKSKSILTSSGGSKWSRSAFERHIRKIEWAMCRQADVDQFRKEIQIHKMAILTLQTTLLRYVSLCTTNDI
jgi:hypothetical protein